MATDIVPMTIRLNADIAGQLALVAQCDGETVADAVRVAIHRHIEWRRSDPNFQAALARHIELAEQLGEPGAQSDHVNLGRRIHTLPCGCPKRATLHRVECPTKPNGLIEGAD